MIPYGRQNISEDDIQAVVDVLRSDYITQGALVPAFEKAISDFCGVSYGIAVNSATSALHIACMSLDVGQGDWVWTSPITFVASSNCALYCGAKVDFVDIDSRTYNMSIEVLTSKLEKAEREGKLPKVVIPVHLCGQSCEMEAIFKLSKKYGFKIIEDASHAIGGSYQGKPIGNCSFSDITIFSFHPVKIITTGEGGMAVTNDFELFCSMQRLRSHGITRDLNEMTKIPDGPWFYQQIELGFNYRMTDIQAALGLSQMKRLNEFVKERHLIVEKYNTLFENFDVIKPWQHPDTYSSFHLYVIRVQNLKYGSHNHIFEKLRTNGILVNLHYIPIYHHPYYQKFGYCSIDFPESERYYAEAISLPIFFGLKDEEIKKVVNDFIEPLHHQNIF